MKIVILNGSPKGNELSVTMYFMYYIEKLFPEHEFKPINIGALLTNMKIRDITFQNILEEIKTADGIVWSFPVYTALIPCQLKKFIELLFEKAPLEILRDKYSAVLSTSMHFYDQTAHNYMHAIIEDLGMKYVGFHSAEMFDFFKFEKRQKFFLFMKHFFSTIEKKTPISQRFSPVTKREITYTPSIVSEDRKIDSLGKRIVILTDYTDENSNIAKMVNKFKNCFKSGAEIYNLHHINMKGGCLGCCKCALENQCVYKDDFSQFFQTTVKNTDLLVISGEIKDRFLSSQWKMYFDRCFHNGHTPATIGTQMCFILSGELSQTANLRQYISAIAELGFGNLVDVITDEFGTSEEIDALIYNMANNAITFSNSNYVAPPTFLEVGGYKIFRDMIYGLPGALFRMDYKFFKKRKMFDFPTKQRKARMGRSFLGLLFKSKKVRTKAKPRMLKGMIFPFKRKLRKLDFNIEKTQLVES